MLLQHGLRVTGSGELVGTDPADLPSPPDIFDNPRSESIYNGEVLPDSSGVFYITQIDEKSRLPLAELAIRAKGTFIQTRWFVPLSAERMGAYLTCQFSSEDDRNIFFPEGTPFRKGNLFLTGMQAKRFGVRGNSDALWVVEDFNRMFSTAGHTFLGHRIRGTLIQNNPNGSKARFSDHLVPEGDQQTEWWDDPEVDVSNDDFWEPIPEFGDWERFFIRDRPNVKLLEKADSTLFPEL